MNLGTILVTRLTTYAPVNNLISGRIYPAVLPDNPTYPAVCYQQVSEYEPLDGDIASFAARYQLECYGRTHNDASGLADAVQAALHDWFDIDGTPAVYSVRRAGRIDDWDQPTRSHRVLLDFVLTFCE